MITENKAHKLKPSTPEPILFGGFDAGVEIAGRLIPKHHPHLISAKFEFFLRNKAQKQGSKKVSGIVKKASPFERHIISQFRNDHEEPDFIVIIALDAWNDFQPSQRVALIDHLLTRCYGEEVEEDGSMKYSIRPFDVQEFAEVVQRHGKWNGSLQEFVDQLEKDPSKI
jgi:hypothetical protein